MKDKKVAIVTGGGSGLGLATAQKFVEEGYIVIITGRTVEKLHAAAASLGPDCKPTPFDMNDIKAIPNLIQNTVDAYGGIDVLVNNAGINRKKSMLEVSDEEFSEVINTNLTSVFVISREVAKAMAEAGQGSIIHISSMAAQYGIPKVMAYTAAKTAVEGMTRAMAVELSPLGIRVNCIAPGFIVTPMTAKAFDGDPARKQKVLDRTPMGKMGAPEDIANMAYFLSSDQAAFVSGEIIKVDGGNAIGF